jgi:protein Tex
VDILSFGEIDPAEPPGPGDRSHRLHITEEADVLGDHVERPALSRGFEESFRFLESRHRRNLRKDVDLRRKGTTREVAVRLRRRRYHHRIDPASEHLIELRERFRSVPRRRLGGAITVPIADSRHARVGTRMNDPGDRVTAPDSDHPEPKDIAHRALLAGIMAFRAGNRKRIFLTDPRALTDGSAVRKLDLHMDATLVRAVASDLRVPEAHVAGALSLFEEGATVPFVARYRKERTGGMDEEVLRAVRDAADRIAELEKRRATILSSLAERELLTEELAGAIGSASTLAELEDRYLPFRPKRKTRADKARESGLAPLAEALLTGTVADPAALASRFVDPELGIETAAAALSGARDIIAETVNEDAPTRSALRSLFHRRAVVAAKQSRAGKKAAKEKSDDQGEVYRDYYDWSEPAARVPSHRLLAVLRGEREGILTVSAAPPEADALASLAKRFVRGPERQAAELTEAVADSYRRLLAPSLENELFQELKTRADSEALVVFSKNLRELLLSPPLGAKRVMGVDPGFRTGCKIVCIDERGNLVANTAIYPLQPHEKTEEAKREVKRLIEACSIEFIAVGNGTGGREAQAFLESVTAGTPVAVVSVNEAGASVYSASPAAREEFPNHDVTVRGAVSIARRLVDPLAELVRIDPKSIGVGQYQHDVDQERLKTTLDETVVSCVNAVGVDVNTASTHLLRYVSGLTKRHADSIVAHRSTQGEFASRRELMAVAGVGAKTFEQAAGFLRVRESDNPLDASGVHPERYALVERIASDLGTKVASLIGNGGLLERVDLERYVDDEVGLPTLTDIRGELIRPGRDPRDTFELVAFNDSVREITDLEIGMKLPGIVTNVTAFGAFVDIGVHRDGLVHVSRLADRYISDPHEVVKVNQRVEVTVTEIDLERKRISLSMIG